MTDLPEPSPAHLIALTDQIRAAIRDKDANRLADIVRPLYFRDPGAARALLRQGLRRARDERPSEGAFHARRAGE